MTILLAILSTACGGVLNPPPPPPTATAFPTYPPRPRPATPTPAPEVWVKNHRITGMWSGPEGTAGVVRFGDTSNLFCAFRIDQPQDNPRLYVYNPQTDSHFWIDGIDVGPVDEPPAHRPGPKPDGVNCTEAIYDGRPAAAPVPPSAPTAAPGLMPTPTARPEPTPSG
ncbi:MAG: hypothetical protein AB7P40_14760 [Chloroflexota bacterium]